MNLYFKNSERKWVLIVHTDSLWGTLGYLNFPHACLYGLIFYNRLVYLM